MNMPCKKCITYAVCKQREIIKCHLLNSYIAQRKIDVRFDTTKYDIIWDDLDEVLPRLRKAKSILSLFGTVIERHYNGYQVSS